MRQLLTAGQILDRGDLQQILRTMADAILALTWPSGDAARRPWLVGVHRGGAQVAKELCDVIALSEGWRPPLGTIDITLYRDDAWLKGPQGLPIRTVGAATDLPGDPTGQRIVLVDDVLNTGRTIRAALNELVDYGRPEAVRLAVLVDRGGRELPIAADVVGQALDVEHGRTLELEYGPDGRMSGARVETRGATQL
jgi:pyrimidine operon attenuation protein/uracil phosphoribosyltransferase